MLRPGRRGLGFAVGTEPLAALFASLGCSVVATDLFPDKAAADGWVATNQHAVSLQALNERGLCEPERFGQLVSLRHVDMNDIPADLLDFDFCWSACSFEHLGSIEHGVRFIDNMLHCLRPGGVGVHTTEYNLSSNTHTLDHNLTVIFREQDIRRIAENVRAAGHQIELDLAVPTDTPEDCYIDAPPYTHNPSLKLLLANHVATSCGLIVEKRAA